MPTRRLVLGLCALLLLVVVAISFAERADRADQAQAPPLQPVARPAAEVVGRLPSRTPIRADVGDLVRVTVAAQATQSVSVVALGLADIASPQLPARLTFQATRPGSYPVVDDATGRPVGTIVVEG